MSIPDPPKTGQHVKIVFRNGTVTEGIVEEWYNNCVQLKALDSESKLIITNPEQDIMLIKVVIEKQEEQKEPELENEMSAEDADEFARQFAEADANHDPTNSDERKSLAQLRIDLINQEKKIIAEKLKKHIPSRGPGKVQYGYPGLGKKPRT